MPREQEMIKGHLSRVIYHRVYQYTNKTPWPAQSIVVWSTCEILLARLFTAMCNLSEQATVLVEWFSMMFLSISCGNT